MDDYYVPQEKKGSISITVKRRMDTDLTEYKD